MAEPTFPYIDTAAFWDGASRGVLMLQFCPHAQKFQMFPRPSSIYSGSRRLEWRAASGLGRLAAWTMTGGDAGPRIHALVDLDEGVRFLSYLVNTSQDDLQVGRRLAVTWVGMEGGRTWPAFAPADNRAA